jgi:HPt (histidine-containing phosphotransfer) domain-containing protein
MREDREAALRAGMDDYLAKPIQEAQLRKILRKWCGPTPGDSGISADTIDEVGGAGVLDLEILAQLRRLETPKRPGFFRKMIDLYIRDSRTYFDTIRDSVRGAQDESRRAAHKLKGSSRNVGAFALADICQRIEKSPQEASAADLEALAVELERVWHALGDVMAAHEADQ